MSGFYFFKQATLFRQIQYRFFAARFCIIHLLYTGKQPIIKETASRITTKDCTGELND